MLCRDGARATRVPVAFNIVYVRLHSSLVAFGCNMIAIFSQVPSGLQNSLGALGYDSRGAPVGSMNPLSASRQLGG